MGYSILVYSIRHIGISLGLYRILEDGIMYFRVSCLDFVCEGVNSKVQTCIRGQQQQQQQHQYVLSVFVYSSLYIQFIQSFYIQFIQSILRLGILEQRTLCHPGYPFDCLLLYRRSRMIIIYRRVYV